MVDLTAKEIQKLDIGNRYLVKSGLGTRIQDIINALMVEVDNGTPVNAVNATKALNISGVVLDGQTVAINNPAVTGTDVYEFCADVALTKTTSTNKVVNINTYTTKATDTLTVATQPTIADTMTIGTKLYTFVANGAATVDGGISVGTDLASAKLAIVAAINGTDGINTPHPLVTASAFNVNVCTITALIGGTAGNAIATTETFFTAGNEFSAATLATGANCSNTNAVTALVAAITANDTQGVGAVDATGGVITLTADVAGIVGNSIILAETLTNGAFAAGAILMSGGVDGTIGFVGQRMVDSSYEYRSTAANTTADKNWRRMSLGSAY